MKKLLLSILSLVMVSTSAFSAPTDFDGKQVLTAQQQLEILNQLQDELSELHVQIATAQAKQDSRIGNRNTALVLTAGSAALLGLSYRGFTKARSIGDFFYPMLGWFGSIGTGLASGGFAAQEQVKIVLNEKQLEELNQKIEDRISKIEVKKEELKKLIK